jgi:hypothetical protein
MDHPLILHVESLSVARDVAAFLSERARAFDGSFLAGAADACFAEGDHVLAEVRRRFADGCVRMRAREAATVR